MNRYLPYVWRAEYRHNKSLDHNHNGVICEK